MTFQQAQLKRSDTLEEVGRFLEEVNLSLMSKLQGTPTPAPQQYAPHSPF